jgi:Winged helix DNA-binding domain
VADAEGVPELARIRAATQLLGRRERRSPGEVVRRLLAVQAQEFSSLPLALRARSRGLARTDVYSSIDSGDLVISWLNRGTLHLVCREDYPWLHALTPPKLEAWSARRLREEGVTDPERGIRQIAKALEDGPLLRKELGERSGKKGPALTHLLVAATLRGLIVRGPIRGREQTFVLTRDHIGEVPQVDREAALTELARRYFDGHAAASEADLAYWSGLPVRDVRHGMRLAGIDADASGASAPDRRRADARRPLPPRLLPPFDPFILGWKERSFAIPAALTKRVMPGGGMFRAVVLVDGRVTGTWSRGGGHVVVDAPEVEGLDAEIADVERFLTA